MVKFIFWLLRLSLSSPFFANPDTQKDQLKLQELDIGSLKHSLMIEQDNYQQLKKEKDSIILHLNSQIAELQKGRDDYRASCQELQVKTGWNLCCIWINSAPYILSLGKEIFEQTVKVQENKIKQAHPQMSGWNQMMKIIVKFQHTDLVLIHNSSFHVHCSKLTQWVFTNQ